MSSFDVSKTGISHAGTAIYSPDMVDRIGPKRPFRIFAHEWIAQSNLGRARIADRMTCSTGTLSKLLNGRMSWKEKYLAGLAYALGIEVGDLFRDPARPSADELMRDVPVEDHERVIKALRALTGTDN